VVYEVTSGSGNIEWNGNNQAGQECSEGTYYYTIKATGKDGTSYDEKGTITLVR
jgi:flagellar hook assembly protein FlgD